jgi:hypothetical protein
MAARSLSIRLWISSSGLFIANSARRSSCISSPVGRSNTFVSCGLLMNLSGVRVDRTPWSIAKACHQPGSACPVASHGSTQFGLGLLFGLWKGVGPPSCNLSAVPSPTLRADGR